MYSYLLGTLYTHARDHTNTHKHVYIYIYKERERERKREKGTETDRKKSGEYACACVHIYIYMCVCVCVCVTVILAFSCAVVANMMNSKIIVSEFELQSRYYVHFVINTLEKGLKPLIPPHIVFLPGWFWY